MRYPPSFRFCPHCSAALVEFVEASRSRRRCPECNWIQYRNPTVGVAVVLIHDGKLLLGKRKDGGWCIPCGHVEWDESVEDAAIRETREETGLVVTLDDVLAVQSNCHDAEQQTVGVWFRGHQTDGHLVPGSDLVEVAYFDLERLPTLKFQTDATLVERLMIDRASGSCSGNEQT